jgi:phage shock protein PspC (stress-responsive transcriptional regulator)
MNIETYSPYSPSGGRKRLQRNTRRRRIGGVCAGLADYTGWDVNLIRFLFLLSMLFGGLGVGVYLALWMALPASLEMPIPKVSWHLQRELRRMQQRVLRLNRKHDPMIADMAQETFEAIKLLAPGFESQDPTKIDRSLREAALQGFPKLLDSLLAMPLSRFNSGSRAAGPAQILVNQLADFRSRFQDAASNVMEREFLASVGNRAADTPELAAWREKLRPLQNRLSDRSMPETVSLLRGIEDKLGFLLQRLDDQPLELLDLRPFEVRKIAFEYLPDTLNEYLRLPAGMVQTERLHGEKTAEESLNEQLNLLDTTLHDLAKSLFEKDAASLLVHGRFLKEKFAEQPIRLSTDTENIRPT